MIKKYVDAMLSGDPVALAACFSSQCRYFDYCPITNSHTNYHVYGRRGVEMFFNNKFFFRTLSISDPVIESETAANFMVAYAGTYLCARATIEKLSEDGLIAELTVRPV